MTSLPLDMSQYPVGRVYYDPRWVDGGQLPRYLTAVPATRARGGPGAPMTLQDGTTACDGGPGTETLLTPDERVRARKKVIATWDLLLSAPRFFVTLHAAACQMDHPDLEARLFVLEEGDPRVTEELARAADKGRRPTVLLLPELPVLSVLPATSDTAMPSLTQAPLPLVSLPPWGDMALAPVPEPVPEPAPEPATAPEPAAAKGAARYFDAGAYRACIAEDLSLLLAAFESEVAAVNAEGERLAAHLGTPFFKRQGYLKLPAMGLGATVALADGTPLGHLMYAPFLAGLRDVLTSRAVWPFLAAVELPDFSEGGAFTPRFASPVRLVTGRQARRGVLDFSDEEAVLYIGGVVSPGSAFALPGNGASASSLESTIAAATTQRCGAWYTANPRLLHPANHIAVRTAFAGQVRWWPPPAWRRRAGAD